LGRARHHEAEVVGLALEGRPADEVLCLGGGVPDEDYGLVGVDDGFAGGGSRAAGRDRRRAQGRGGGPGGSQRQRQPVRGGHGCASEQRRPGSHHQDPRGWRYIPRRPSPDGITGPPAGPKKQIPAAGTTRGRPVEYFCLLAVLLAVVTFVGHGIWELLAWMA